MRWKNILRKFLIVMLIALVIIQFIPISKNQSNDQTKAMKTRYPVPEHVQQMFEKACYNCHSNYTEYPWYCKIQPVGFWVQSHIDEGKREINFSEFAGRSLAFQNHKFHEIIEQVKEKEMPLDSYLWEHPEAKLSDADRKEIIDWSQSMMDSLKANVPADSLVMKKRPRPQ